MAGVSGRARARLPEFTSPVHDTRVAAWLGIALGVTFSTCFVTGLYSHFAQHPPSWFELPARPAGLYRFTQGLHVATGLAAIPLLLAKLWAVYPKLFRWPPFNGVASVVDEVTGEEPLLLELRDKYRFNYGMQTMTGPAIVIDVERWSGWDASDSS